MHREPTLKAQATILRQVFADNGVAMGHRKALDVVARLHGHADWHVMSSVSTPVAAAVMPKAPAALAAPTVAAPGRGLPVRRARPVADGPLKCFRFDGIAYVETREKMDALDDISYTCTPALWATLEKEARALGFTCVGSISVEEDDEQDDEDIKVFVSVELYGRSRLRENESAPAELASILDHLCAPCCTDAAGNVLAEPSDWEVLSVDSHLDTVPKTRRSYVFEAAGFVATREQLQLLPSTVICKPEVWAQVKEQAATCGFDMVGNIDLCEDDGAHDTNIKVYQCVRLQGRSYLTENMPLPSVLIEALSALAEPLRRLPDGSNGIGMQHWELSAIEPIQGPMMML